ncbi:hypothetical protein D3C85_1493580 [compost metagenome]
MKPAYNRNTQSLQFVGFRARASFLFVIDSDDSSFLMKKLSCSDTAASQAEYDHFKSTIIPRMLHVLQHLIHI